jgi:hypothetical protein
MKLHPEDPRLTAYVLGELGTQEAAAVKLAVEADPLLQAEVAEIEKLQLLLTSSLALPPQKLLPSQRDTIRKAARAGGSSFFSSLREALQPWVIPASAAAVLTVATTIFFRMSDEQKPVVTQAPPAAPSIAPQVTQKPTIPSPPPDPERPFVSQHGLISAADSPTLDLPLQAIKPGLAGISKSIQTDGKLPVRESVHLEEILNSFAFRLNGTAAIARSEAANWHPDNRDSGMSAHVATLSTEMIACPWRPSSTLLFISLRGGAQEGKSSEVKVAYHANQDNVFKYRLLGFTETGEKSAGSLPFRLAANSAITLAIEIEPSKPGTDLGSLAWSTDGNPAPEIRLVHKGDADPSDDARFAALVCTYAQWLAGEQPEIIDADIVSALARETASSKLSEERSNFLLLIDKSLHL